MIVTTTSSIEGKVPTAYLGVIGAEVIFGANFVKDWLAEGSDFWGGRNTVYEKIFEDARTAAVATLEAKASARGANAVLNIRFDYSVLGATNGMLMVAATGTAVVLVMTREEKALQALRGKEQEESFMLLVDGKERGPFSIAQIRDLHENGRIDSALATTTTTGTAGPTVGELLNSPAPL